MYYVSNIIYLTLFIIMTHVQIVTHLMGEILTLLALVVGGIPQWSIYSSSSHVGLLEGSWDSFLIPNLIGSHFSIGLAYDDLVRWTEKYASY
jgi:hypothetical protein